MGAMATVNSHALALAAPLLAFACAALYLRPPALRVELARQLEPPRARPGDAVALALRLQDRSQGLEEIFVRQPLPQGLRLLQGDKDCLALFGAAAEVALACQVEGARGSYVLPAVALETRDPFGLLREGASLEAPQRLFILPQGAAAVPPALRMRRTRAYPGLITARKGGPGVEFHGLREYQTGDSWRWLNHRVNARQEAALFVNEFELERAVDAGIILDVRAATNLLAGRHSLLEHGVQAAATLADALLSYGNRVGLFIFGGSLNWTFPGSGKVQYEKILRALANAKVEQSQVFGRLERVPTRLFPSRSWLALISPLQREDRDSLLALRAHGYQVNVIIPDPVAYEMNALEAQAETALAWRLARLERDNLRSHLLRGGIRVCEWDTRQPFAEVMQQLMGRPVLARRAPSRNG